MNNVLNVPQGSVNALETVLCCLMYNLSSDEYIFFLQIFQINLFQK